MSAAPRTLAVMQPYVFPYLGYFHLLAASDRFIFYDDVNYRPRTWMNRNRILVQGAPHTFTVPVSGGSQNAAVGAVHVAIDDRWRRKFFATLRQAYVGAPGFRRVSELLDAVLSVREDSLADVAIESITSVLALLGRPLAFERSSTFSPESVDLGRAERLAHLTLASGCDTYVNLPSGRALYDAEQFRSLGVELCFIRSRPVAYDQPGGGFVADLSIIDALMWAPVERVAAWLDAFDVEPG